MAQKTLEHVFEATGVSISASFRGPGSMLISGVGTVTLERSWDNGATFQAVNKNSDGDLATYAVTAITPVNLDLGKGARALLYRFNCTAFTSTIVCKLGV